MILNPAGEGTGLMLFSGVFDSKENGEEGIGVNSLGLSWSGVGDKDCNEASECNVMTEGWQTNNLMIAEIRQQVEQHVCSRSTFNLNWSLNWYFMYET